MGRPGKPAPEPKSRRVLVSTGMWRAAKRLSPKWRRTISSGSSRIAVRLVRGVSTLRVGRDRWRAGGRGQTGLLPEGMG